MNKQVVALIAVLLFVFTTGSYAVGLGIQYNGNAGDIYTNGAALTLKLDKDPVVFAASYYIGDDKTFGLTCDYWLFNDPIGRMGKSSVNWFFGVGLFSSMIFTDDFGFISGVRIPLGINMMIDKKIEPFIQAAPSFGIGVIPTIKTEGFYVPLSAGFRIWF
jgi:hypothetical protein